MPKPTDNEIVAVALRRMAILSDEPKEVRERAERLAEVFEAQEVVNEDEGVYTPDEPAILRSAAERILNARRSSWAGPDTKAVDPHGDASVWLFNEAARIEAEGAR